MTLLVLFACYASATHSVSVCPSLCVYMCLYMMMMGQRGSVNGVTSSPASVCAEPPWLSGFSWF